MRTHVFLCSVVLPLLLGRAASGQTAPGREPPKKPAAAATPEDPAATPAPTPPTGAPVPTPRSGAPVPAPTAPAPQPTRPSPAPPESPPPAPSAAPTGEAATGEEAYDLKLRGLEEKVNELKEKIFRSKARLLLLQETVLHGSVTGAYAIITHRNDMGSLFKLEHASYHLDGAPIYQPSDPAELERKKEFPIFNGAMVPGNHTISVYLVYRGASSVFPYWQGYQFKIKSSYTFHFEEGKITHIKVVGHEKGGVTTDLKDRPSVRFDVDVQKLTRGAVIKLPEVLPKEAK
jgi:hypothetical protein